jgi:SAM-dependent methyltransferase
MMNIVFPDHKLAHKYCRGEGVELGAAAHNPFNLENCINIAPKYDERFYSKSQMDTCGRVATIDLYGDAEQFPLSDGSKDYIISSHVVEHIPDLIGSFMEWNRVLRKGGVIFIIFPKRDALITDVGRPLSTIEDFETGHKSPDRIFSDLHLWVFSLQSMIALIDYCNYAYDLGWILIDQEETDTKVGNGHTVVYKKIK